LEDLGIDGDNFRMDIGEIAWKVWIHLAQDRDCGGLLGTL